MGNVWSKKPFKEVLRENKRMINRAIRELDRERTNLERAEASGREGGVWAVYLNYMPGVPT